MEKTSHEVINKLFARYYETYNSLKFLPNKTANQLDFFYNARDLSNADLYVFIYTFRLFYFGINEKKPNPEYHLFDNNLFFQKYKLQKYKKFVIYSYFKQ
jgi:hypothetical protein